MKISSTHVNNVLIEEDIEGLLEIGAPNDEYIFEARDITTAVSELSKDQQTLENIVATIALIWAKSFGVSRQEMKQRLPAITRVAQQLLAKSES